MCIDGTTQELSVADELLVRERLRQLKSRYCRFIDTKQWERLRGLFTADARFEGLGSVPSGSGVDGFVAGVSHRLEFAISIHQCHMPEFVQTGSNTFRGVWAMTDYLEWPEARPDVREAPGSLGFRGYGHYEEEYRQEAGEWKIAFLRLTRLRIDAVDTAGNGWLNSGALALSSNWV